MGEPTDEDYCATNGHAFFGVDAGVGSYYCGQVTWAQPPEEQDPPSAHLRGEQ